MKNLRHLFILLLVAAGVSGALAQECLFSQKFSNGIPVQITNNRDKGYAIKLNSDGITVGSGEAQ